MEPFNTHGRKTLVPRVSRAMLQSITNCVCIELLTMD